MKEEKNEIQSPLWKIGPSRSCHGVHKVSQLARRRQNGRTKKKENEEEKVGPCTSIGKPTSTTPPCPLSRGSLHAQQTLAQGRRLVQLAAALLVAEPNDQIHQLTAHLLAPLVVKLCTQAKVTGPMSRAHVHARATAKHTRQVGGVEGETAPGKPPRAISLTYWQKRKEDESLGKLQCGSSEDHRMRLPGRQVICKSNASAHKKGRAQNSRSSRTLRLNFKTGSSKSKVQCAVLKSGTLCSWTHWWITR